MCCNNRDDLNLIDLFQLNFGNYQKKIRKYSEESNEEELDKTLE